MNKIAVVMPVYNEANTIAETIRSYQHKLIEKLGGSALIIAEDGSTDGTKDVLRELQKEVPFILVSGSERKGYTRAFKDALRAAQAPLVFFSDSDGQHDPADFLKLYELADRYDIVSGYKKPRRDPLYRLILSRGYNFLLGCFFGLWLKDINSGFKVIKRSVIDDVLPETTALPHCVMSEFILRAYLKGYTIKEVPVSHFARAYGSSLFNVRNLGPVIFGVLRGLWTIRQKSPRPAQRPDPY